MKGIIEKLIRILKIHMRFIPSSCLPSFELAEPIQGETIVSRGKHRIVAGMKGFRVKPFTPLTDAPNLTSVNAAR
jgi:hypothetical protein